MIETNKGNRFGWVLHLAVMFLYMLYYIIQSFMGFLNPAPVHESANELWMGCLKEFVIFFAALGIAWFASRATLDDLLLRWRGTIRPVVLGVGYGVVVKVTTVVVGVGVYLACSALIPHIARYKYLLNGPGVGLAYDLSALRTSSWYYWSALTIGCFGNAGLLEELWRSAFLAGMMALWPLYFGSRLGGKIAAVVICAAVFGMAHLYMGLIGICGAGLLGVIFGGIMLAHRSIWPAVIAHGIFDATTVAMLPWIIAQSKNFPS